jgi:hypothetical protein
MTGTITGSFVYDADTNVFSSVAITTTFPPAVVNTFSTNEIGGSFDPASSIGLQVIDNFVPGANTGKPTLAMSFLALTNLGGSRSFTSVSFAGLCGSADCAVINFTSGGVFIGGPVAGQLTGTPVVVAPSVPEPATLFLCSAGLIGAGVRRWRQRRA